MKKLLSLVSFILSGLYLNAQDTTWNEIKIDENLTISMPGKIKTIDTIAQNSKDKIRFRIFKAETTLSTLGVMITPKETNIKVDNKEDLRIALDGIAKGSCTSAMEQGFTCQPSDTLIDDIPGKKLKIFYPDVEESLMSYYWFLINNKAYTLTIAYITDDSTLKKAVQESNRFLGSVHFNKTELKEQQFGSKAESTGYKIGYAIGSLLFVVAIGFVIYFVFRKN